MVTTGAWLTAALMRYPPKRRLPRLETLLRTTRPQAPQTPDQQKALMLDWARRGEKAGLAIRIGRLEAPLPLAQEASR